MELKAFWRHWRRVFYRQSIVKVSLTGPLACSWKSCLSHSAIKHNFFITTLTWFNLSISIGSQSKQIELSYKNWALFFFLFNNKSASFCRSRQLSSPSPSATDRPVLPALSKLNRRIVNRRLNLFSGTPFYPPISYPRNKKFNRGINANLGLF